MAVFLKCFRCLWGKERKVYVVEPFTAGKSGGAQGATWDFTSMGALHAIDFKGIEQALSEAERSPSRQARTQQRRLVFCKDNRLTERLLKELQTLLRRHPTLSVTLDTDWRRASAADIEHLATLLGLGNRCLLRNSATRDLQSSLLLPSKLPLTLLKTVSAVVATAGHTEIDALVINTPELAPAQKTVKIELQSLRLSSQELVFKSAGLHDVGTVVVGAFLEPTITRLQVVRLVDNSITDAGVQTFMEETVKRAGDSLRELCLSSNKIGDSGAKAIAEVLPTSDVLERLLLDRNQIGPVGAKALATRLPRSNVKELVLGSHLGGNPVGAEGAEALSVILDDRMPRVAADRATRLTALSLEECKIGEMGAKAIAAKLPRSALCALSVAHCNIGDEAAGALLKALPMEMLSLDLAGNQLTETSASLVADTLHTCGELAVSLAQNKISPHLQAALREEHAGRLRL